VSERLKIAVSACFFHADAARPIFTGKTLQYIEQSVAHWVAASGDALPVMVPSPLGDTSRGRVGFDDYAAWLDGLVLNTIFRSPLSEASIRLARGSRYNGEASSRATACLRSALAAQ